MKYKHVIGFALSRHYKDRVQHTISQKSQDIIEMDSIFSGSSSIPVVQEAVTWETLYEENFDAIHRLALGMGVVSWEAEDVVQRVFLVAHRKRSEIPKLEKPLAWLRGITVRIVAEYRRWRRVRRAKEWLLRSSINDSTSLPRTPEQGVLTSEAQYLVQEVLNRMSPKLRDVLVLMDLEENGPQEVAQMLDIPVNTVRSRKRLARQEFIKLWRTIMTKGNDNG